MILEDIFQVVLKELLIIQNWSYHGVPREALLHSPKEQYCLLKGSVSINTKVTFFDSLTCMHCIAILYRCRNLIYACMNLSV